jgi:hypothetical protein
VNMELVVIDVKPGSAMESQSGLNNMRPRVYGVFAPAAPGTYVAGGSKTAALVMHPASNFMGHYLIEPLSARGIAVLALNSRYVNNDSMLSMERVIQDLGAGVKFLRERGFDKVVLLGNSGGASLTSFYQAQAENLTVTHAPCGMAVNLVPQDLPRADAISLFGAHEGRSYLFAKWLDPSVLDEHDAHSSNPALDMFNLEHGPPYSPEFLSRFSAAQIARRDRIERWVGSQLAQLAAKPEGPQDQAFIIYRTHADPRTMDASLDANDRPPGMSIWGVPRAVNYGANAFGRYTSLRAFMSQLSAKSHADGPANLARTSVPLLLFTYTADASTFPSTRDLWLKAGAARIRNVDIKGGNHYLAGQPALVTQVADEMSAWMKAL